MIVVDASVLIAHLDARDRHHADAAARLAAAAEHPLAASPLTLAEVLVGPARARRLDAARGALRELGVRELPLPSDAAWRLAALRAETGLRLPDCCVLLDAQEPPAESVMTFDERLAAEATRIGLTLA